MVASKIPDRLFVLDMANHHEGNLAQGREIIEECASSCQEFSFTTAISLQYANPETFIHPTYQKVTDCVQSKTLSESRLTSEDRRTLVNEIKKQKFLVIAAPLDESSVDAAIADEVDILKIAGGAFGDWPLLEHIAAGDKPLLLYPQGADSDEIDAVISFLENRQKDYALMHCSSGVGKNLRLNRIDEIKTRYPNLRVGYAMVGGALDGADREHDGGAMAVCMAMAKSCTIFECGVRASKQAPSGSKKLKDLLRAAEQAFPTLDVVEPETDEWSDSHSYRRGLFAKRDIKAGERIRSEDAILAAPSKNDQVNGNDWSKYNHFFATEAIAANAPVLRSQVRKENIRDRIVGIVVQVQDIVKQGNIVIPKGTKLEISHHYGLERFEEYGAALITVINRQYCKKLIVVLPNQKHPNHLHRKKDETLHVLHGTLRVTLEGDTRDYTVGETIIVEPGMNHSFESSDGCVFEEISSTHYVTDSVYTDESINGNAARKTLITYWNGLSQLDMEKARKQIAQRPILAAAARPN